ncbi:hypothetical protein HHK36_012766 [Tetracentron sinense]|uniref:TPX2 C-terminal domain-containing protein n=1 Tax=Tetracentron sinense TaxID=13715 RepID=A0A834Z9A5_TETSI|nr:hypothetical protein HHK36_012766 [Tetracentron sinense]
MTQICGGSDRIPSYSRALWVSSVWKVKDSSMHGPSPAKGFVSVMGREVTNICMDKGPDQVIGFSNSVAHDPVHEIAPINHDLMDSVEHSKRDLEPQISEENTEVKDYEVKECTIENSLEITEVSHAERCPEEQDVLCVQSTNFESGLPEEKTVKPEAQKSTNNKSSSPVKPALKSAVAGNVRAKYTVPQPFALATEKRASCGTRPVGTESAATAAGVNRSYNSNNLQSPNTTKKPQVAVPEFEPISPLLSRKPLQPDNKKHPDEEDACSVTSSKSRTTVASAPKFRCTDRAEKRKEFYSKLEEKHQALEAEKTQCEARTKEEREAAIKQLRKSLTFKANPMPSFYHEGPPPKVELKKLPPTRAKSPKLGRRKSCSDAVNSSQGDKGKAGGRANRLSLGNYRGNNPTNGTTNSKDQMNGQNGNAACKAKDGPKQVRDTTKSIPLKMTGQRNVDIIVES